MWVAVSMLQERWFLVIILGLGFSHFFSLHGYCPGKGFNIYSLFAVPARDVSLLYSLCFPPPSLALSIGRMYLRGCLKNSSCALVAAFCGFIALLGQPFLLLSLCDSPLQWCPCQAVTLSPFFFSYIPECLPLFQSTWDQERYISAA